ncbi:MAG: hypothetical protein FD143_3443, partial [Ignavibacteria bacterium]
MADQNSSSADSAEAFSSALNTQSSSATYHTAATHPSQSDVDLSHYYIPRVADTQQNFAHTYPPADFDTIPSHSLPNPLLSQPQSHTEQSQFFRPKATHSQSNNAATIDTVPFNPIPSPSLINDRFSQSQYYTPNTSWSISTFSNVAHTYNPFSQPQSFPFAPHTETPEPGFDQPDAVESEVAQPSAVDPDEPAPKRRRVAADSESGAHNSWAGPIPLRRASENAANTVAVGGARDQPLVFDVGQPQRAFRKALLVQRFTPRQTTDDLIQFLQALRPVLRGHLETLLA